MNRRSQRVRTRAPRILLVVPLLAPAVAPASAQQTPYAPDVLTAEDYARAEQRLGGFAGSLVAGTSVNPVWMDGDRFTYRSSTTAGWELFKKCAEYGVS